MFIPGLLSTAQPESFPFSFHSTSWRLFGVLILGFSPSALTLLSFRSSSSSPGYFSSNFQAASSHFPCYGRMAEPVLSLTSELSALSECRDKVHFFPKATHYCRTPAGCRVDIRSQVFSVLKCGSQQSCANRVSKLHVPRMHSAKEGHTV